MDVDVIKRLIAGGLSHNLEVYGGFVRDHIIPQYTKEDYVFSSLNPEYTLNDLDFWARTDEDALRFVSWVQSKYQYEIETSIEEGHRLWSLIPVRSDSILPMDIVSSPDYPNPDSPLNLASYDGREITLHESPFTIDEIKHHVKQRRFLIYTNYYQEIMSDTCRPYYRRRIERFRRSGWVIEQY